MRLDKLQRLKVHLEMLSPGQLVRLRMLRFGRHDPDSRLLRIACTELLIERMKAEKEAARTWKQLALPLAC